MHSLKRAISCKLLPSIILSFFSFSATAQTQIFFDDFESGDLSHTDNNFTWSNPTKTSVTTSNSKNGSHALLFDFGYKETAEQRFVLGKSYKSISIEYDLYIPDGKEPYGGIIYDQYNADGGPTNDKFLRLWDKNDYSGNPEKIGSSTSGDTNTGLANHYTEWNSGDGMNWQGHDTQKTGFITTADRGQWIHIKSYFKHATENNNDGVVKMYKNGELIYQRSTVNNYHPSGDHAWFQGYLLGSRSGTSPAGKRLYLLIDNFEIWDGESSTPKPPSDVSVTLMPN